jgi:hypothetical protein
MRLISELTDEVTETDCDWMGTHAAYRSCTVFYLNLVVVHFCTQCNTIVNGSYFRVFVYNRLFIQIELSISLQVLSSLEWIIFNFINYYRSAFFLAISWVPLHFAHLLDPCTTSSCHLCLNTLTL